MSEQMQKVDQGVFEQIELDRIRPSKTNPRGRITAKELEEITESVRTHGVLQTIVVRPSCGDGKLFEIVAGERRWRAAQAAKLPTIPAMIRELTDDQVVELQVIENLQRADLHPLDEAKGYKALVKQGLSVEQIAGKVSKSPSYVYQRLKLAELIPAAATAFRENRISAHHAIQIARLQPPEQNRALNRCFAIYEYAPKSARETASARLSVRELADFIANEIHLDLTKAPFPVADEGLVKKAGACTVCPKRAGNNPQLFPDISKADTCTDPGCYQEKVSALVQLKVKELTEAGENVLLLSSGYDLSHKDGKQKNVLTYNQYQTVKDTGCAHTRQAILVDGRNAGKAISACVEQKCKQHWGGNRGGNRHYGKTAKEREIRVAKERKQKAQLELDRAGFYELTQKLMKRDVLKEAEWRELTAAVLRWVGFAGVQEYAKAFGYDKDGKEKHYNFTGPERYFERYSKALNRKQLPGFILAWALESESKRSMRAICRRYQVNIGDSETAAGQQTKEIGAAPKPKAQVKKGGRGGEPLPVLLSHRKST